MKFKTIIFLLFSFALINISTYIFSKENGESKIQAELDSNLQTLTTHYDILMYTHENTAEALYQGIAKNRKIIEILSKAKNLSLENKVPLRDELYQMLKPLYERAKIKGVFQLQFVFPDNRSFLRMHKPSKFGDDLSQIRPDFRYVNETKKPLKGFTQGRTSHGFRNVFPLFDSNKEYLGAVDISFSSEDFQWYLNNISHIHTHFLVDQELFNALAWTRNDLILEYSKSAENPQYLLSLFQVHSKEFCIEDNKNKLKPIIHEIREKMQLREKFSTYVKYKGSAEVISFLPIKDVEDHVLAWLVSYVKTPLIILTLHSILMVRLLALIISILLVFFIIREIKSSSRKDFEEHILSLVNVIENRDSYTGGHSHRVASYSLLIAKEMRLSQSEQDILYKASMVHDIGKISTPDSILLKPGKLSTLEYEIIKEHASVGYELLKHAEVYKEIAEVMRYHHERYDAKGYPNGLKGEETPLLSQIMMLSDAFDAMTTNRIYKPRKSVADAFNELDALSGIQFNPKIVKVAKIALSKVKIEESIDQRPISKMEQERFSYFYKDPISGLYNKVYLERTLSLNSIKNDNINFIMLLSLSNFNQYNKKYGWEKGDRLLGEIAKVIESMGDVSLKFRIHGDNFILLSDKRCDIEEYLGKFTEVLQNTEVHVRYKDTEIEHPKNFALSDLESWILDKESD